MNKELRKSFLFAVIMALISGGQMLMVLFSQRALWIKSLSVLIFIIIVSLWTWLYYRDFKFRKVLNQYAQSFHLSPEAVAQVTGQSRYDFYYLTDNKTMVFYSGNVKRRKYIIESLVKQYGKL
ncbi:MULTISPECIES: hypothetical protein [Enterococcus]|uniref:hypothetical protein n=1 Tax=Enterococcus TaxID=1350 RepID=UPI0026EAB1A4|nr:hypothetical protein [Enterococcus sp. S86.2]